nr:MAG TPA: hypothetical protein [Caudoviricetes sp.]
MLQFWQARGRVVLVTEMQHGRTALTAKRGGKGLGMG